MSSSAAARFWVIACLLWATLGPGAACARPLGPGGSAVAAAVDAAGSAPAAGPIPAAPPAGVPGALPTPAPPKPIQRVFVQHIEVTGNTLLPSAALRALVAPYEGRELSLADVKKLAEAITAKYRQAGYLLAHAIVPTQEMTHGTVRILVVEGRIAAITVQGARHYSPRMIERRVRHSLVRGRLQADRFQRALLLLNEYPDLQVHAVLRPGKATGTTDLVLAVEDHAPYHATVEYNNFGTQSTGKNKAALTLEAGNLAGVGDALTAQGTLGFPSRNTNSLLADYSLPVNADGTRVGLQYVDGVFAVGRQLEALNIRGRSTIAGLSLTQKMTRTLTHSEDLTLEADNKNSVTTVAGIPLTHDHYSTLTLTYSGDNRYVKTRTVFHGSVTQGLGGTASDDPQVSRPGASGSFNHFNGDVTIVRTFTPAWFLLMRASAQYTFQPLLLSEEYALGGPDTVRGYTLGEVLGDMGYDASAELHWAPLKDHDLLQLVAFLDHGTVYVRQAQPGQGTSHSLTGAGAGVRMTIHPDIELRLDLGFPIDPNRNATSESPIPYVQVRSRF